VNARASYKRRLLEEWGRVMVLIGPQVFLTSVPCGDGIDIQHFFVPGDQPGSVTQD